MKPPKPEPDPIGGALLSAIASAESRMRKLASSSDDESISKQSKLARLYCQLAAEYRKYEMHKARINTMVTRAAVMDWVKALTPSERAAHVRECQAIDTKRSGLA